MNFSSVYTGLLTGGMVLVNRLLALVYPPFCAHCLIQLDEGALLCPSCFAQVELVYNSRSVKHISIFAKTPVTQGLCKKLLTLQGAQLVPGVAGYIVLQLGELDALDQGFYVQKGLEDLGYAIEKLSQKKYLGALNPKRDVEPRVDYLCVEPRQIDPKTKERIKSKKLRCIYLLESEDD